MPEKFMTWLNEEIKNLENEHTESNQFIWGKHAEAVRIRAKAGEMDIKDRTPDLEEIAGKICDRYCRFPEAYDDTTRMFEEKCEGCPLNELVR